jgi:hypothetical protein
MAAPYNPSVALDNIGASIAELQATHLHYPSSSQADEDLKAEAKRIDDKLVAWARSVPLDWKPIRLTSGQGFDSSIPSYMRQCDNYPSCQIANIWNLWRLQRLVLLTLTLGSFDLDSTLRDDDLSQLVEEEKRIQGKGRSEDVALYTDVALHKEVAQELVDAVCFSIPFYLGNRTLPASMADFTNPDIILLPRSPSTAPDNDPGMLSDEHKGHIIAQGPWHIMSPLSRLLTLFSEHPMLASLLRPGQCQWIRAQFMRLMTIMNISAPTGYGYGIDSDKDVGATADFLAKQVRKGAMFMSGP